MLCEWRVRTNWSPVVVMRWKCVLSLVSFVFDAAGCLRGGWRKWPRWWYCCILFEGRDGGGW